MMVNTVRAAIQGLHGSGSTFERTPKYGVSSRGEDWRNRRYQLRLDPIVYLELVLAVVNGLTVALALYLGNWLIAFYAAIFFVGLLFTSGVTIEQAVAVQRSQAARLKR